MFRAIAAAIADLFSRTRASGIAPPRVGLTSSSREGGHISSVDAKIGGIHTRQQAMGVPGLRDDGDKLSSQPEPEKLPRNDGAEEPTAVQIPSTPGRMKRGTVLPDAPQSKREQRKIYTSGKRTHTGQSLGQGQLWVRCEHTAACRVKGEAGHEETVLSMKNFEDLLEEEKDLVKGASRDLVVLVVQILKGYDGSNCPMNEENEGVIVARSSDDQNPKNEDLYFEPMGIFGIYGEEIFDDLIEEVTYLRYDLTMKESLVEDTMLR